RNPESNRQETGQHGANPGDQQDDHHQSYPLVWLVEMPTSRVFRAKRTSEPRTTPPTPRYRHIMCGANGQWERAFPNQWIKKCRSKYVGLRGLAGANLAGISPFPGLIAALRQG